MNSPDAVLDAYEGRINRHDFELLVPLIAADASFWFSDGSFIGHTAIRAAFERTWANLADETYWLDERRWLARGDDAAACSYRFNWQATVNGSPAAGQGRGTTILRRDSEGWRIVHEHLSGLPA